LKFLARSRSGSFFYSEEELQKIIKVLITYKIKVDIEEGQIIERIPALNLTFLISWLYQDIELIR
jgi:hypothetical protein